MQFLLKPCQECNKPLNGGVYRYRNVLVCPHCDAQQDDGKSNGSRKGSVKGSVKGSARTSVKATVAKQSNGSTKTAAKPVTSKSGGTSPEKAPVKAPAKGAVTAKGAATAKVKTTAVAQSKAKQSPGQLKPAEVKLVGKDAVDQRTIAENFGELKTESQNTFAITPNMFSNGKFVGSKLNAFQESYNHAKKDALQQLRRDAAVMGANTVSDVAIKYSVKDLDGKAAQVLVKASGLALIQKEIKNIEIKKKEIKKKVSA